LFVTAFVVEICASACGTTIPSDSRCAARDFAFGLYAPPRPDVGCADGPLVFRAVPCTRAAPRTPSRSRARSGAGARDVAFAV